MTSPLIRINHDSAERITELHGVSTKLAERIVRHRTSQGYFRNPDDLDKVKGVSLGLANALAPHIDWSIPEEAPPMKERSWPTAIIISSAGLVPLIFAKSKVIEISNDIQTYQQTSWGWLFFWMSASIAANMGLGWLLSALVALHSLVRSPVWADRLAKAIRASLWAIFAGTLSLGLSNFIYYQYTFPSGQGWSFLFASNKGGVLAVIGGFALFLLFIPIVVDSVRLKLLSSPLFHRLYDVTLLCVGVLYAVYVLFARQQLSLFFQIAGGLVSLVLLGTASATLMTGMSFHEALDDLVLHKKNRADQTMMAAEWLKWLNNRLPDISQQKELKKALDGAYPPSKVRTLTSVVFITVCGWIILQSVGAVIQWVIQKWLENLHLFQKG